MGKTLVSLDLSEAIFVSQPWGKAESQSDHHRPRPLKARRRKTKHSRKSKAKAKARHLQCRQRIEEPPEEALCSPINSMRAVLPGQPAAKLQAVCTGYWDDKRLIVCFVEAAKRYLLMDYIGLYHWECFCYTNGRGLHSADDIRRG